MAVSPQSKKYILKSIEILPPQKVQEVIDFIEFLKIRSKPSGVDEPSILLQQDTLVKIWGDEEDLYELMTVPSELISRKIGQLKPHEIKDVDPKITRSLGLSK